VFVKILHTKPYLSTLTFEPIGYSPDKHASLPQWCISKLACLSIHFIPSLIVADKVNTHLGTPLINPKVVDIDKHSSLPHQGIIYYNKKVCSGGSSFLFILNGTKWFFFIIYSNNVLFVTIIVRISMWKYRALVFLRPFDAALWKKSIFDRLFFQCLKPFNNSCQKRKVIEIKTSFNEALSATRWQYQSQV
jgi:hypothetical protein